MRSRIRAPGGNNGHSISIPISPSSSLLVLFAIPAESCPWHSLEPRLGNSTLADLTDAEPVLTDPSQCVLNCPQETNVGLMQPDVQSRFSVGIRWIGEITHRTSGTRRMRGSIGMHSR